MKYLFTLLIFLLLGNLPAQNSTKYSRVKIDLTNVTITDISMLGLETDHGELVKGRYLINDFADYEISLLENNGFEYDILIDDVQAHYVAQNHSGHHHDHGPVVGTRDADCDSGPGGNIYNYTTPANYQYGSMGGYLTYDELLMTLDSMVAKYPELISARQPIGTIQTHEGRPIYWLRLSDNPNVDEEEPEILYTALHHAREPNSLSQMVFYLWYMLENYDTDPEVKYLLEQTEMYFIPCINPDGYVYNEDTNPNGGGLWRKNRYEENGTVYGVDLNRNYGYFWGFNDNGSSPNPTSQVFRGPSAFSEPETQAVSEFCNAHQFKITLNYHTYGNLLIHPWGYSDQVTSEDETFKGLGKVMCNENNYTIGTGTETVGYTVNGNSDDWMYGETSTKPAIYSMTPEVGPGSFGFWPPQSAIDQLNKSSLLMNLTSAHLLLNYGEVEELNAAQVITSTNASIELKVKKYGLASGDQTLTVSAGSNNVTVNSSSQTWAMNHLDEETANFSFEVQNGTASGEELVFLVQLDNGTFIKTDTLTKQYINGNLEIIFTESGDNLSQWQSTGSWGTTSSVFVTAPTSITDSPNGDYDANEFTMMTLQNPIDLIDYQQAYLRFHAQWEIENGYDFVQVMASSDGNNFTPLCGKYTVAGTGFQAEDEPLYDGNQEDWVYEEMDLTDYIGGQLWIRFQLISDGGLERDGFYFDDLTIEALLETPPIKVENRILDASLNIQPNPFNDIFHVGFDLAEEAGNVNIQLVNVLGKVVHQQSVSSLVKGKQQVAVNSEGLSTGIYLLHLQLENGQQVTRKVIKR